MMLSEYRKFKLFAQFKEDLDILDKIYTDLSRLRAKTGVDICLPFNDYLDELRKALHKKMEGII